MTRLPVLRRCLNTTPTVFSNYLVAGLDHRVALPALLAPSRHLLHASRPCAMRTPVIDPLTGRAVVHYDLSTALSWPQCQQLVANGHVDALLRLPAEIDRYQVWTATIKAQYASAEDFILSTVFSAPPAHPGVKTVVADRAAAIRDPHTPRVVLRLNDFPYNLRPGIEHWVLWRLDAGLSNAEIVAIVDAWIRDGHALGGTSPYAAPLPPAAAGASTDDSTALAGAHTTNGVEWCYWVNPAARKTIAGVWHAHILVHWGAPAGDTHRAEPACDAQANVIAAPASDAKQQTVAA
ncbi:hypothetical protein AMAG_05390 [Allomyces macrogynus ATCC 38327]|uniref:Uncharacterized protein n=1 Tax=Allomyces macrogynus (strain ATCC 38327) TaxID=578462 RepID=A0A0L0SBK9_ALLM3|nr:hypothetical protein AMAG_05390 [Allomyces macrogynus ATCC 38327]|eukprot:KNE59943.1 hypothetical protein AMAG_05390 [Allomyces macrogynus ATCC 38327]